MQVHKGHTCINPGHYVKYYFKAYDAIFII